MFQDNEDMSEIEKEVDECMEYLRKLDEIIEKHTIKVYQYLMEKYSEWLVISKTADNHDVCIWLPKWWK